MMMLDNKEDSRITVVENDNLDKMADVVSGLFEEANSKSVVSLDEKKEEELFFFLFSSGLFSNRCFLYHFFIFFIISSKYSGNSLSNSKYSFVAG